ncbi:hypothetical protein [Bradyrhizobium erythrophlei]|uniref:Uncharacterized protein n=1 Tax=Bradyrhizobium erythrophlei TaxID=1437360 RepID=A0A1H4Y2J7_9BRAD|nr:hypothetical protein [Bradyrhizobium erythrophlei]SED12119.1 hypothetical protein SAMN05444164_3759 [Bradyrhizobium erythrophlei]
MSELTHLHPMDQFYLAFGKAMAAWGEVEYGMSIWFMLCTGLPYDVAKELFFSPKSYSARSDLFTAALDTAGGTAHVWFPSSVSPRLDPHWLDFVAAGRNKAIKYNSVRNKLAHGVMHPSRSSASDTEWRLKEPAEWQRTEGFTQTQLLVISRNFRELSSILRISYLAQTRNEPSEPFVRALLELPNDADSIELSEMQKLAISKLSSGSPPAKFP